MSDKYEVLPTLEVIQEAHARIKPFINRTPVMTSRQIDEISGASLFFKCENFQRIGAFKARGATNAIQLLTEAEMKNGVTTHSSGNHAQAVAMAAKTRGIPAYVVMPNTAPKVKVNAVQGYGAEVIFCEPTLEARESTCNEVVKRTGAAFIHGYNDFRIIAGQATAALELLQETPELDIMMCPIGGGGLACGTALAVHYMSPKTQMIAAEPLMVDDAYRSKKTGKLMPAVGPKSICDGLLTSLSPNTFEIVLKYIDQILTASEAQIIEAMHLTWERMKIIIEPSSAVPLACILANKEIFAGKKVGVIISGGNLDLQQLPWQKGLSPKNLK